MPLRGTFNPSEKQTIMQIKNNHFWLFKKINIFQKMIFFSLFKRLMKETFNAQECVVKIIEKFFYFGILTFMRINYVVNSRGNKLF